MHEIHATCMTFRVTQQQINANDIFISPVLDVIVAHLFVLGADGM